MVVRACTLIMVHAYTMITVHVDTMIIVHACTMKILHAFIIIVAHACIMIISQSCAMIMVPMGDPPRGSRRVEEAGRSRHSGKLGGLACLTESAIKRSRWVLGATGPPT